MYDKPATWAAQNALRIAEQTNESAAARPFNQASEILPHESDDDGKSIPRTGPSLREVRTPVDLYKQAQKIMNAAVR